MTNWAPIPNPIQVSLGDRSYDIHVERGLLPRAGEFLAKVLPRPRIFLVTDEHVAALHLTTLQASLAAAGIEHVLHVLPPGEHTKDFAHLETLLDAMLATRLERSTGVVALGGGVIGDITGFASAIALRGVPFVQIPTTLLAQVDSSVGGKTAIDTRHGKNLVGAFYQPLLVLADIDLLGTLPDRQIKCGYAEVVKYGLIDDPDFFDWLEGGNGLALLDGDSAARRHAVAVSCVNKARIVSGDERETGQRALLNLGHTFAHALEAESGFGDLLLHGEAVSIGMVMAFQLSVRLGLCPPADLLRMRRHLLQLGMPVLPPPLPGRAWDPARLIGHMASDKKVRDRKIAFVLAKGIGKAFLSRDVAPEDAQAAITAVLAQTPEIVRETAG